MDAFGHCQRCGHLVRWFPALTLWFHVYDDTHDLWDHRAEGPGYKWHSGTGH